LLLVSLYKMQNLSAIYTRIDQPSYSDFLNLKNQYVTTINGSSATLNNFVCHPTVTLHFKDFMNQSTQVLFENRVEFCQLNYTNPYNLQNPQGLNFSICRSIAISLLFMEDYVTLSTPSLYLSLHDLQSVYQFQQDIAVFQNFYASSYASLDLYSQLNYNQNDDGNYRASFSSNLDNVIQNLAYVYSTYKNITPLLGSSYITYETYYTSSVVSDCSYLTPESDFDIFSFILNITLSIASVAVTVVAFLYGKAAGANKKKVEEGGDGSNNSKQPAVFEMN